MDNVIVDIFNSVFYLFRLHQMHEMLTVFADVCGVCLSVCLSCGLNRRWRMQYMPCAVCVWGHLVQLLPNTFGLLLVQLNAA